MTGDEGRRPQTGENIAWLFEQVGRLHEAALEPARWHEVLRASRSRISIERSGGTLSIEQIGWLDEMVDSAARVAAEVARLQVTRAASASASDALPIGILVVDGRDQILQMNREARRLLPETTSVQEVLAAFRQGGGRGSTPTIAFRRVLRHSACTLEVLAVPVEAPRDPLALPDSRLIVFVVDPARESPLDEATLAVAFDLTPAEARLAKRLLCGDTVEMAARALGLKITTARTHLSRVFQKTGTTRQPALLRVLLAVPTASSDRP